jgi:rhodanese-related sulfurtransferase
MQTRYQTLLSEVKQTIKEMTPQEVANADRSNAYIVDVREDNEWQKGHVPDAVHVNRGILEGNIERIVPNANSTVILYCAGGARSALAAESLMRMGYTSVYSMQGGFGNWLQLGLPVSND